MLAEQSTMYTLLPLLLASILVAWLMYDIKYGGYASSSEYESETGGWTTAQERHIVSQVNAKLHKDMEKLLSQQVVNMREQLLKHQQEDLANMKLYFKQIVDEALILFEEQRHNATSSGSPSAEQDTTKDTPGVSDPKTKSTSWTSFFLTTIFRLYLACLLIFFIVIIIDNCQKKVLTDELGVLLVFVPAIVLYAVTCGV